MMTVIIHGYILRNSRPTNNLNAQISSGQFLLEMAST